MVRIVRTYRTSQFVLFSGFLKNSTVFWLLKVSDVFFYECILSCLTAENDPYSVTDAELRALCVGPIFSFGGLSPAQNCAVSWFPKRDGGSHSNVVVLVSAWSRKRSRLLPVLGLSGACQSISTPGQIMRILRDTYDEPWNDPKHYIIIRL